MKKNKPDTGEEYFLTKFIGRCGPFTEPHKDIVERALTRSKFVGIDLGSCFQPRIERTPFLYDERVAMIRGAFPANVQERILITPIMDSPYNNVEWQTEIQKSTNAALEAVGAPTNPTVALIGHAKDFGTGFYLKMFPQWGSIEVENLRNNLSATTIRDSLYTNRKWSDDFRDMVPPSTNAFLRDFSRTEEFKKLLAEVDYYRDYRAGFEAGAIEIQKKLGFKPTIIHHTVDALLVHRGHVLLIQRKTFPGKDLWALPGGFVNPYEWLSDGFIRELREETKIKVPSAVLRGSLFGEMDADYPYRSMRGHVISKVFGMLLSDDMDQPEVKGRSDAKMAKWVPIADIKPEQMFEDHYHIIQFMLAQIKNKK